MRGDGFSTGFWTAFALFAVVALLFLHYGDKNGPSGDVETRVDTLFVRDTITREKAIVERVTILDTIRVPVVSVDTLRLRDTVFVYLAREQLMWSDSLATVYVSGIRPAVDSVVHYTQTTVVTVYKRQSAPRVSFGVQAGYGVSSNNGTIQARPYIGVGLNYRIGKNFKH